MKKSHRKQKKVSMTSPSFTAVNTPPESFPPRAVGVPDTYIGLILELFHEETINPSRSNLAKIIDSPQSHVAKIVRTLASSNEQSEERQDYLAFCKRAGVTPLPIRVVAQSHDEKTYTHYAAYCATIGVEPHSIERWDSLRDQQDPLVGPTVKPSYKVDRGVYPVCASLAGPDEDEASLSPVGDPACFTRPAEHPITFDKHLARSACRPSLQKVNRREMSPFEYGKQLTPQSTVTRKVKNPEKNILRKSLWCEKCSEYVAQPLPVLDEVGKSVLDETGNPILLPHQCPPAMVTCSSGPGGSYPIEQKARQLLIADAQKREQEHSQRIWFPQSRTTTAHKVGWDRYEYCTCNWCLSADSLFKPLLDKHIPSPLPVVLCDPEVFKQPPSLRFSFDTDLRSAYLRTTIRRTRIVVDNLAPACTPHSRIHYGVREFSFTTGHTIRICSCAKFDKERKAVLLTGNITQATPGFIALWDATLDKYNLSEHRARMPLIGDQDAATSSTGRVNTAGWSGTDHDGIRHDSNARDRRAQRWFVDQQDKEPKTKSKCLKCGADIYAKAGTNFCPDTDCAQRFQEAWAGGLKEELLKAAQHDPTIRELFEHINRNRS